LAQVAQVEPWVKTKAAQVLTLYFLPSQALAVVVAVSMLAVLTQLQVVLVVALMLLIQELNQVQQVTLADILQ
jgi:hypothetical protein